MFEGEGLLLSTYKQPSPLGNFILADISVKSILHTNKLKVYIANRSHLNFFDQRYFQK